MENLKKLPPLYKKPLTLSEIILYNMAGFAFNVYDTVLYMWIIFFYAGVEGSGEVPFITLSMMGVLLFAGRMLDAVTDPLFGYLSDHTKSRWGRRKPYIFAAAPVLFLSFILLWTPPVSGTSAINAVYLAVILFFYYVSYTAVLIPWFAVLPEMSPNNDDRVKIASIGVAIGIIGALIAGGISGPLFNARGIFIMALILGAVAFVASELTLFGVHERHRLLPGEEAPGFIRTVRELFSDKQVLSFSAMIMFVQLTYQLLLMNIPYVVTLILGKEKEQSSIIVGEVIILMALSVPIWYFLLKRYAKRKVFRGIILAMMLGFVACYFIGGLPFPSPFVQAMLIFPLAAIPLGGVFVVSLGVISDLTDYGELKNGKRNEAIYFGIYGIVRKTGWAFSGMILSGVFYYFGYSANNPFGVRLVFLFCALVSLIGLLAFIPYRLGDSKEETKKIMGL